MTISSAIYGRSLPAHDRHDTHPNHEQNPDAFISLKKVNLVYGEKDATVALAETSLSIEKGSFVAIVGPSGCGKSSLLRLISGLTTPTSGSVTVAGKNVTGPIEGVGMAFQNPTLLPWRTTVRNAMLPFEVVEPHCDRFRSNRKDYVERTEQLLDVVGLRKFTNHFPWQLSGGMQQRTNLCRALVHEPNLLLLDEPFAALDAFTREDLWRVLQQLWTDRLFTAVLITHDLREAVYLADTVLVMSPRPGVVLHKEVIDLPRPRTLAMTFESRFIAAMQTLRDMIGEGHTE